MQCATFIALIIGIPTVSSIIRCYAVFIQPVYNARINLRDPAHLKAMSASLKQSVFKRPASVVFCIANGAWGKTLISTVPCTAVFIIYFIFFLKNKNQKNLKTLFKIIIIFLLILTPYLIFNLNYYQNYPINPVDRAFKPFLEASQHQ